MFGHPAKFGISRLKHGDWFVDIMS